MSKRERLVCFVPLPAGWRAVYWNEPGGDLSRATDEDLYYAEPIACLAHVEIDDRSNRFSADGDPSPWSEDDEIVTELRPVIAEESRYFTWEEDSGFHLLFLLGPVEECNLRQYAITAIQSDRVAKARKQEAARSSS